MSKPFAFGIGKSKPKASGRTKFALGSAAARQALGGARSGLDDSDHEDDGDEPKHESVTGFSADGAVLSKPALQRQERVIQNAGNSDWRKRGKAATAAVAQNGGDVVVVERDEVSTASGLQFAVSESKQGVVANGSGHKAAEQLDKPQEEGTQEGTKEGAEEHTQEGAEERTQERAEDEAALAALLDHGSGRPKRNAVIVQKANAALRPHDETADFRADVASRPDSSTLQDYAAMPVEEFGLAMLRGMGKKRRANGEPAPGSHVELGAWGKADMRKNDRGEGFFIPLMRVNEKTGERLTEDELQQRVRDQKSGRGEEDWRDGRDRRLGRRDDADDDKSRDR
ncbi:hypothetical protein DV736_g4998, partial [Chaetothyriales sp. CBS 134916]